MAIYYAPGVYIEEPDRGTKPIEGVSTSVTAFIGYTEKAEDDVENKQPMRRSILSEPKTITSLNQYREHFGGLVEGAYLPYAVRGFFENGGTRCYVISVKTSKPHRAQALIEAKDSKTGQSVPYLFLRAKEGGYGGKDLSVELTPLNADTADPKKPQTFKFSLEVKRNGVQKASFPEISLGQLPHWDFRDVDLSELERMLSKGTKLLADSALEATKNAKIKAEAARAAVQSAKTALDAAIDAATSARSEADQRVAKADQAIQDANTAQTQAQGAETSAVQAERTAVKAEQAASNAQAIYEDQSKSEQERNDAKVLLDAAETAREAANVAKANADRLKAQAEAGSKKAQEEKTFADEAQQTAAEAERKVTAAKADLTRFESAAADTATSTTKAAEASSTAQAKAQTALASQAGVAFNQDEFDTAFARILGRAYENDQIDKTNLPATSKIFQDLHRAGIEVWRGTEMNRPLKIEFNASGSRSLEIDVDRAFNVDTDKNLLVSTQDMDDLQLAKDNHTTFERVNAEQYRGYGRKGLSALEELDDVNLICAPDIMMLPDEVQQLTVQKMMIEHCERMQFRFAILDAPKGKNVDSIKKWRMDTASFDPQHGHAALYYPWIKINDPLNPGQKKAIPPSGHIAGIYARSDAQRGVYKAPANEPVNGVIDLEINVNLAEQGMLNPIGINCIRKFSGRGIRVWGARTLALTDPSWRYVNVRRLFNFVEASIERSTQWIVFEPNDQILWGKVRRDITAFMRTVWLSGALFGNTPDEAFYVKCDAELNPPETRDLGYLFVEIGLAPVKPAEFAVFRISQWAGPNAEA